MGMVDPQMWEGVTRLSFFGAGLQIFMMGIVTVIRESANDDRSRYRLSGFGRLLEECIAPHSLSALTSLRCSSFVRRVETGTWIVDFITDFITDLNMLLYGTVNVYYDPFNSVCRQN